MKIPLVGWFLPPAIQRRRQFGVARLPTLLLIILGVALGGLAVGWYRTLRARESNTTASPGDPKPVLSASTRAVLTDLKSPVILRFHALFSLPENARPLVELAGRVEHLLAEFESASHGRLQVTRQTTWSAAQAREAAADGLLPQNLEQGEPSYLGVLVAQADRREVLAQITPDWEAALEFDLARAIARVANPPTAPRVAEDTARLATATEEVRRALPNVDTLPLAQGKQQLLEAARKDFETAVTAMQTELQAVQARIRQAEADGQSAAREAGLRELQQLQARRAQTLAEITHRSEAQVEALEQLKRN